MFSRDEFGARPWIVPGTPEMQHRIGGLERDTQGNVSYDPDNHQAMTNDRHAKVAGVAKRLSPPEIQGEGQGDLLLLGWGSTLGALTRAYEKATVKGQRVSRIHLRHLWPLAPGLREIFKGYRRVLVPELNMGQLALLLRAEFQDTEFVSMPKVTGQPFLTHEITAKIDELVS